MVDTLNIGCNGSLLYSYDNAGGYVFDSVAILLRIVDYFPWFVDDVIGFYND